jgi:DMSO/TMAO reductase YedYZ molybdopterin-dependent catalytic subunit
MALRPFVGCAPDVRLATRLTHACVAGLLALATIAQAGAQTIPQAAPRLVVTGEVERELTLTLDDLRALPQKQFEDVRQGTGRSSPGPSSTSDRPAMACSS